MTRLLTDEGHAVEGVDISPEMVGRARAKVPEASFRVADAVDPGLEAGAYDVVLSRHVLWAMPDPVAAIATWVNLLRARGLIVLVEGRRDTDAGLTAVEAEQLVRMVCADVMVRPMPGSMYWGRDIHDERYLVVGRHPRTRD